MSKPTFQLSYRKLQEKWGAGSAMQIQRLAKRGVDFDAPDEDVAKMLFKRCMKKPKAMYQAIYDLSSIKPRKPEPEPVEMSFEEMVDNLDVPSDAELKKMLDELLKED